MKTTSSTIHRPRHSRHGLPNNATGTQLEQTYRFWRDPHRYLERCAKAHGDTFTLTPVGKPPLTFLSSAADIKAILGAAADTLHPGKGGTVIAPLVGDGSFMLAEEDRHLEGRRAVLPLLTRHHALEHSEKIRALAEDEVGQWPHGSTVPIHDRLRALALRVILATIFGWRADLRLEELRARLLAMFDVTATLALHEPRVRPIPPWRRAWREFLGQRQAIQTILDRLITDALSGRGKTHGEFVEQLFAFQAPQGVDPVRAIRETIMSLILAGHETTAAETAWTLQLLANNPSVKLRLTEELHSNDGERYLTAVIQEALRHRPVFLFAIPRAVHKSLLIGQTEYRPPCHLVGCIHLLHHDPRHYERPNDFEPERFLGTPPRPDIWMPWGGGRKRCPGRHLAMLEMKTILEAVLTSHRVGPATSRIETARWRSVIVAPGRGCQLTLDRPSGCSGAVRHN